METWRTGTHYSLSDTLKVLDASGTSFSTIYNNDQGLSFANYNIITQTLGLTQLPAASYTIEYLTSILNNGPIMAVIMYSSSSNIAHMIVITGISGDGTPEGTSLQINDPLPLNAGKTYSIAFNDFLSKFEQVVAYENNWPNTDLTSQLFYFAENTSSADSDNSNVFTGNSENSGGQQENVSESSNTSTDNSDSDSSSKDTNGNEDEGSSVSNDDTDNVSSANG
jgi:hypothetical protein